MTLSKCQTMHFCGCEPPSRVCDSTAPPANDSTLASNKPHSVDLTALEQAALGAQEKLRCKICDQISAGLGGGFTDCGGCAHENDKRAKALQAAASPSAILSLTAELRKAREERDDAQFQYKCASSELRRVFAAVIPDLEDAHPLCEDVILRFEALRAHTVELEATHAAAVALYAERDQDFAAYNKREDELSARVAALTKALEDLAQAAHVVFTRWVNRKDNFALFMNEMKKCVEAAQGALGNNGGRQT